MRRPGYDERRTTRFFIKTGHTPDMRAPIWRFISKTSRVWKVAFAAGLAWEVAKFVGFERPYFAPLAAILCLQVTVAESLSKGLQRILGIVCGVIVADLLVRIIGVHGWSVALLVLAAIAIAMWLRLGKQAISQVGVSAMMVLTVGHKHDMAFVYSFDRIFNTLIGAAIAIVVNMFVFPPDYTNDAAEAVKRAADQLAGRFRQIAEWLTGGADADAGRRMQEEMRDYVHTLHDAVAEADQAMEALQYSPLLKRRRTRLEHLHDSMLRLRQGYAHAAGVLRTFLEWQADSELSDEERRAWAGRCESAADWIPNWAARIVKAATEGVHTADADAVRGEQTLSDVIGELEAQGESQVTTASVHAGALWNDLWQLAQDLHSEAPHGDAPVLQYP